VTCPAFSYQELVESGLSDGSFKLDRFGRSALEVISQATDYGMRRFGRCHLVRPVNPA
jgi:hypothetical protein